jgi:hypothetical protein
LPLGNTKPTGPAEREISTYKEPDNSGGPDDGADRHDEGTEPRQAQPGHHSAPQARDGLQDRQMKTVLVYVDTGKHLGDPDHLKVFANEVADEKWFMENDFEGVAFEYPVIGVGKD